MKKQDVYFSSEFVVSFLFVERVGGQNSLQPEVCIDVAYGAEFYSRVELSRACTPKNGGPK